MVTTARPRVMAPAHAAAGPPPRTVLFIGGMILLAVLIMAAVAVSVWRVRHASTDRASHTVTGAVAGRDAATLDLLSGVTTVTVTGADLGDVLYRVRTPEGGRMVPSVTDLDGRVGVQLNDRGGDKDKGVVTVELNRDVRWSVRFTAGATSNTADLRGLREIGGVEYLGGVSAIELSLPAAKGVVPVRMSGGASTFVIHLPQGPSAKVVAGGGAGSVTIDGTRHDGVAGGTALQSGDPSAADRYEIGATVGVSSLTVDRY